MNKAFVVFSSIAVFLGMIFIAGCETTKGVATGVAEGVSKDTKTACSWVKKADNWIKDNLW